MMALITGGASCGKSMVAERVCTELGGRLVYLAAMRPFGEEGARRVRKHRAQRAGKGFETVECYERFSDVEDDDRLIGATVLLESLGNVVANELFDGETSPVADVVGAVDAIDGVITHLAGRCAHLVVVGDEVGGDGISYAPETEAYQETLGALLCKVAESCELVVECVSGVPCVIKWTHADEGVRDPGELLGLSGWKAQ